MPAHGLSHRQHACLNQHAQAPPFPPRTATAAPPQGLLLGGNALKGTLPAGYGASASLQEL
jgi:hypothetical protein